MGLWHRMLAVCFRVPSVCFAVMVYRMLLGIEEKRVLAETTAGEGKETRQEGEKERYRGKKGACLIWCQCEYSVIAKKGRRMIQPYSDRVVGRKSAQVLPYIQTETYRAEDNGEGRESKGSDWGRGKKEGMRCREPRLHPSCGLVQKPFVPIVLYNLFSQSLQWEGWRGDTKLWQPFIFALIA